MPLAQQDLQQIGEYVKNHISEWIAEQSLGKPPEVYELELRERMVRVEEALKHQHELMRQGFEQVDRRLELMAADMDKRFDLVNKRFEQVDKRFEQVDKRFEQVDKRLEQVDKRLDLMKADMDKRFEQVDKRLDLMKADMDKRFEQVDKRLDLTKADMDKRFEQVDMRFNEMLARHDKHFFWLLGFITTGVGLVIAAIRYL
ncbi:hypothetical protein [uncultured Thiohalocapsa sp.]|uniref:hypothetical protein n=1 Tax=uncultured Thiohalocapsa sp. TaxID=768990 RepID=UPI0025EF31DD|nr:hypothetical protein [uncultured Thiohalocapsa sp.]